jgi:hypothetical protein
MTQGELHMRLRRRNSSGCIRTVNQAIESQEWFVQHLSLEESATIVGGDTPPPAQGTPPASGLPPIQDPNSLGPLLPFVTFAYMISLANSPELKGALQNNYNKIQDALNQLSPPP